MKQSHDPVEEPFDPADTLDLNAYPPATAADLAVQTLYRDLPVSAPPADAWDALLADLADRAPATRALWQQLAARTRTTPVPAPDTATWTTRAAALRTDLAAWQARFQAHAEFLAAQTRALQVPPPSADQWAFQQEALQINLARLHSQSDRIAELTRDARVAPDHTAPGELQTDWQAVEAAIRQGHTEAPPPVAPARWDRLWDRIQSRIDPAAAAAAPKTAAATAASAPLRPTVPANMVRPRHGFLRWAATGLAAAALALLAVTLWRHAIGPAVPGKTQPLPAQTAVLESAEILDMGTVDDSVTTVVRTTSGDNPVTVVVIVNQ